MRFLSILFALLLSAMCHPAFARFPSYAGPSVQMSGPAVLPPFYDEAGGSGFVSRASWNGLMSGDCGGGCASGACGSPTNECCDDAWTDYCAPSRGCRLGRCRPPRGGGFSLCRGRCVTDDCCAPSCDTGCDTGCSTGCASSCGSCNTGCSSGCGRCYLPKCGKIRCWANDWCGNLTDGYANGGSSCGTVIQHDHGVTPAPMSAPMAAPMPMPAAPADAPPAPAPAEKAARRYMPQAPTPQMVPQYRARPVGYGIK